jgi:hypothetical protein
VTEHITPREYFNSAAVLRGYSICDLDSLTILVPLAEYFMACAQTELVGSHLARLCHRPKGTCENDVHGYHVGQIDHYVAYVHAAIETIGLRDQAKIIKNVKAWERYFKGLLIEERGL